MIRHCNSVRNSEAGFALLLVYAMAATVAIMLYMQLPRVAFEAQRDREQLLIDRGEQYKRAVQLYVRKFQRFPVDIAALESTQNIRFLRKQYVDPMTGKNEWRIIHVGAGGVFVDSQIYGTQQKKDASAPQTFITEMQPTGGAAAGNPNEGVNLATRRRPSDSPGGAGDPGNLPLSGGGNGEPGAPANNVPVMVLPDGRIVPATTTGVASPQPAPPGSPGVPGVPVIPGQPGVPLGQPGSAQQPGQPVMPGQFAPGGFPNGLQNQPNAPPASAANLINQLLTTPRPQPGQAGQASNTGTPLGQGMGGQVVGGGIAGVASKYEQDGIKLYNDRNSYNQWEFVYDMTKDPTRTGNQTGTATGGPGRGATGSTGPTTGITPK